MVKVFKKIKISERIHCRYLHSNSNNDVLFSAVLNLPMFVFRSDSLCNLGLNKFLMLN